MKISCKVCLETYNFIEISPETSNIAFNYRGNESFHDLLLAETLLLKFMADKLGKLH